MISKLNKKALLEASDKSFRIAIIRKINKIIDEVNVGVVHDNKVKSDRNNISSEQAITEQDLFNIENRIMIDEINIKLSEMEGVSNE